MTRDFGDSKTEGEENEIVKLTPVFEIQNAVLPNSQ